MIYNFPQDLKHTAFKAVDIANKITLQYFRTNIQIDNKKPNHSFDPVTLADTQAEQAIREIISHDFPNHGIIGEEHTEKKAQSDYTWIIDPIDGTRGYIAGLPSWGTLIGVLYQGKPIFGLMAQPLVGDLFYGDGQNAFLKKNDREQKIQSRFVSQLSQATMFCTTPDMFEDSQYFSAFHQLRKASQTVRYGTDCYGYMAVASGWGDIVFETDLKPVDILPLVPIIRGAGAIISDLGTNDFTTGTVLVTSSVVLFDKAMQFLK